MDIQKWEEFKTQPEGPSKRKMLGDLIAANEMLVRSQVAKLCRHAKLPETDDLFQAGRMGLMRAIEKYNPERGPFGPYAAGWIRDRFQQCSIHEVTIYQPRRPALARVVKKANEIENATGKAASAQDLGMTEKKFVEWKTEGRVVGSIEGGPDSPSGAPSRKGGTHVEGPADGGILEIQQEDDSPSAEDRLAAKQCETLAVELLDLLEERERAVITSIFLEEKGIAIVAKVLKMAPNTVIELRDRALAKLREEMEDT